jgi:hypothetical protein
MDNDLAQTVISAVAVLVASYAVLVQRRTLARQQELSAATALFTYYNSKISSLRDALLRDTGDRAKLHLGDSQQNEELLKELLQKHATLSKRFATLFNESVE